MTASYDTPAALAETPPAVPELRVAARREFLVADRRLVRAQRLHAWLITALPALGVVAAIGMAILNGVSAFDLALLAGMYVLTMLGITTGYHRQFAHRAYRTPGPVRALLAILGSMAAQGSPVYWVSNHRRHHRYSDGPGDPHSPHVVGDRPVSKLRGLWHAQFGWPHTHLLTNTMMYAPDLLRDPWIAAVNRRYYLLVALGLALPAGLGWAWHGTAYGALSGLVWGGLVRLFISYHAINSVNSVTHMFGSRPYDTPEHSTNHVFVAIAALGEGWHNNHHAFPASAQFGHRWWQIDIGYWPVALLGWLGLAHDVVSYRDRAAAIRQIRPADRPLQSNFSGEHSNDDQESK